MKASYETNKRKLEDTIDELRGRESRVRSELRKLKNEKCDQEDRSDEVLLVIRGEAPHGHHDWLALDAPLAGCAL